MRYTQYNDAPGIVDSMPRGVSCTLYATGFSSLRSLRSLHDVTKPASGWQRIGLHSPMAYLTLGSPQSGSPSLLAPRFAFWLTSQTCSPMVNNCRYSNPKSGLDFLTILSYLYSIIHFRFLLLPRFLVLKPPPSTRSNSSPLVSGANMDTHTRRP